MKNNTSETVKECKETKSFSQLQGRLEVWKLTGNNLLYGLGCFIMVIASFLPYVNMDEKSMSLMDGTDGIFFLMFAVLIFIFIAYEKKKIVGILGLVLTYCGAYELVHTLGFISKTGQTVNFKVGYFVLLVGTLVVLAASSYFVYRNGLKDLINRIFDRFFPMNESE